MAFTFVIFLSLLVVSFVVVTTLWTVSQLIKVSNGKTMSALAFASGLALAAFALLFGSFLLYIVSFLPAVAAIYISKSAAWKDWLVKPCTWFRK